MWHPRPPPSVRKSTAVAVWWTLGVLLLELLPFLILVGVVALLTWMM